jgi:uncharacterized protein YlxP (DUF503 family)
MPVIGVLHLELRIDHAQSLKDRRNVIRSLKARLRSRHNVAVAEIGPSDILNRALVSAVTISNDRAFAEKILQAVDEDAAAILGGMLESSGIEWVE